MDYTHFLRQQCYINGKWCDADNGATINVSDPGKGKVGTSNNPRHFWRDLIHCS